MSYSLRAVLVTTILALAAPASASAAPGDLDPSFGDGGKVITPFDPPSPGWSADSVAAAADGRIVIAGTAGTDETGFPYDEVAVRRYLPDGSPDASFAGDGLALVDLPGPFLAPGVAAGPAGEVFVVTTIDGPGGPESDDTEISVVKLDTAGNPDPAFGEGDGIVNVNPGPGRDYANDLELLAAGGLAVSATVPTSDTEQDFALIRLTSEGALDPAFGAGGIQPLSLARFDLGGGLAAYADGRIAVAGQVGVNLRADPIVARLLPDGSPDEGFGGNGRKRIRFDGSQGGESIALGPNGGLLVGFDESPGRGERINTGAARLKADGRVDRRFGDDGLASTRLRKSAEYGDAGVAAAPGGKVIVAGNRSKTNFVNSPSDFFLARFDRKGELDRRFGKKGTVTTDFGSDSDYALGLAMAPGGEIVLAGSSATESGGPYMDRAAIARYEG